MAGDRSQRETQETFHQLNHQEEREKKPESKQASSQGGLKPCPTPPSHPQDSSFGDSGKEERYWKGQHEKSTLPPHKVT